MRTNLPSFALTVGMALLVVLMGFGALSAAGLVGFAAEEEALATLKKQPSVQDSTNKKEFYCLGSGVPSASSYIPTSSREVAAISNGDALFKANCTQCHAVNEKVVGPALAGIAKRRSIAWLVPWVQNSAKVVASDDEYAVKLYNDNGKQQMPSFDLTKKEIRDIMAWIASQEGSVSVGNDAATTDAAVAIVK